ncbi:MAG: hypothetical protein K6G33_04415 [Ruminococcus sp.]|uniref:SecDF P1 head subdomain-containing protein n=1 Tax=Ruminococcus sp. TaxID=41978 RepID=UPI0025DE7B82|nr:hypothetical protein [Ruminococcus sp.]MCR5599970.1 hypothetical protein [Ruminococcus sp.]
MKKGLLIAVLVTALLSGCTANTDSSKKDKSNSENSTTTLNAEDTATTLNAEDSTDTTQKVKYLNSITLKAEDSDKLQECTFIACLRLVSMCDGLEYNVLYNDDGTSTILFNVVPQFWSDDVLDFIVRKGEVSFRKGTDSEVNSEGETVPTGEIAIDRADIKQARNMVMPTETDFVRYVDLELSWDGGDKFAEVTKELADTSTPLTVWLDNEMIHSATVSAPITYGSFTISGGLTDASAAMLSAAIEGGPLPCGLEVTDHKFGMQ